MIVEANLGISRILQTPRPQLIGRKLSAYVVLHRQDRWLLARCDLIEVSDAHGSTALETVSASGSALDLQIVGTSARATAATPREIHLALIDVNGAAQD